MTMDGGDDILVVAFTREEALELFMRCLRSHDDDNAASNSILKKLAKLLEQDGCCERVAC